MRETDRFDERIGTGEVKREVILMLKDMNSKLQVHYCALLCLWNSTGSEAYCVFLLFLVCRSRTLTGVVFWKCFEMFLEPCGTSCIAKPILRDKKIWYDVELLIALLNFSLFLRICWAFGTIYVFLSFCVGCERLELCVLSKNE